MTLHRPAAVLWLAVAACGSSGPAAPAPVEAPRAPGPPAAPASTRAAAPASEPARPGPADPARELLPVDATTLAARLRARPERALLVNVWSTWCEPCVAELPALLAVARRYAPRGLGLVLISADAPSQRGAALAALRARGVTSPGWFKEGPDDAFVRALHPDWSGDLPVTLLLDAERRPRGFWPEPVDEHTLRTPLEALLGAPPSSVTPTGETP